MQTKLSLIDLYILLLLLQYYIINFNWILIGEWRCTAVFSPLAETGTCPPVLVESRLLPRVSADTLTRYTLKMSIGKGEIVSKELPRVKFGAKRIGKPRLNDAVLLSQLQELGALQQHLEEIGIVPILEDGLVGGNCSLKAFHT
jgi:hypothetical protein